MLRIIKIMADYNKDVVADRERDRHPMATSDGEFEDYETRMSDVIRDGYENCDPERWLKVIPQLIANIDMQYVNTLGKFGRVFPSKILFDENSWLIKIFSDFLFDRRTACTRYPIFTDFRSKELLWWT